MHRYDYETSLWRAAAIALWVAVALSACGGSSGGEGRGSIAPSNSTKAPDSGTD